MGLNKKQKKQIDVARKKKAKLQVLLTAAKQQTDDPQDVINLQNQIAEIDADIEKIQSEG